MDKRMVYMAKLGIFEGCNENGEYDVQRIDCPEEFAEENHLSFVPPLLEDDAEAKAILQSLTHNQIENINR